MPVQRTPLLLAATATLLLGVLPATTSPAEARTPKCQGRLATIVGTGGDDRLVGTRAVDVIIGRSGDDKIVGGGGNDVICGGGGADSISGGAGNDRIDGGADLLGTDVGGTYLEGDLLRGGPGDDVLIGGWDGRKAQTRRAPDTYSWTDSPRGVRVDLSGTAGVSRGFGQDQIQIAPRMRVLGSTHDDELAGSGGADVIEGFDGNDQISGRGGDDRLLADRIAGTGRDLVIGGDGRDLIGSYAGRDDLRGGGGNDFVETYGAQPTTVRGGAGSDRVAQSISILPGMDTAGGAGRDTLTLYGEHLGGHTPRTLFEVDLRDGSTRSDRGRVGRGKVGLYEEYRLVGDLRWMFYGSARPDRVWTITGGNLQAWTYAGNDWVHASDRNDRINAGKGTDTVVGDAGTDVCQGAELGTC